MDHRFWHFAELCNLNCKNQRVNIEGWNTEWTEDS